MPDSVSIDSPLYHRIYAVVQQIPEGHVATYGQIARMVGRCSAKMVGFALAALKSNLSAPEVPWQRVINQKGKISIHGDGFGNAIQRSLLEQEGVIFDSEGCIDFRVAGWDGPDSDWMAAGGFFPGSRKDLGLIK
jgi:methylated-DNA-protein-cysteine methyltransferase-like protein